MWIDRLSLGRLRRECTAAAEEEETAGYELALSARRFSQHTQLQAEDRLAFSATLMRAGEAAAASRLIWEFERDVRADEAVLVQRVDEVKAARAAKRSKVTRLRLARLLATALLGATLLAGSAAGMTFASFISEATKPEGARLVMGGEGAVPPGQLTGRLPSERTKAERTKAERTKIERIAGVRVAMSPRQYRAYRVLLSPGDVPALQRLLMAVLDGDAHLVERVTGVLAEAPGVVASEAASIADRASDVEPRADEAAETSGSAGGGSAPPEDAEDDGSSEGDVTSDGEQDSKDPVLIDPSNPGV